MGTIWEVDSQQDEHHDYLTTAVHLSFAGRVHDLSPQKCLEKFFRLDKQEYSMIIRKQKAFQNATHMVEFNHNLYWYYVE